MQMTARQVRYRADKYRAMTAKDSGALDILTMRVSANVPDEHKFIIDHGRFTLGINHHGQMVLDYVLDKLDNCAIAEDICNNIVIHNECFRSVNIFVKIPKDTPDNNPREKSDNTLYGTHVRFTLPVEDPEVHSLLDAAIVAEPYHVYYTGCDTVVRRCKLLLVEWAEDFEAPSPSIWDGCE